MAAADESSALHELQSALHKYLSLGSGTPLYSQAETMSTAVTHALAAEGQHEPSVDHAGVAAGGSDGESSAPMDFRSARQAANKAVYGNGASEDGTKADESEQSQEDEAKKKKGSRPF